MSAKTWYNYNINCDSTSVTTVRDKTTGTDITRFKVNGTDVINKYTDYHLTRVGATMPISMNFTSSKLSYTRCGVRYYDNSMTVSHNSNDPWSVYKVCDNAYYFSKIGNNNLLYRVTLKCTTTGSSQSDTAANIKNLKDNLTSKYGYPSFSYSMVDWDTYISNNSIYQFRWGNNTYTLGTDGSRFSNRLTSYLDNIMDSTTYTFNITSYNTYNLVHTVQSY